MAQMLDEAARSNTVVKRLVDVALKDCLADHLYFPFHVIVFRPLLSLIVFWVVYILICIIIFPFYVLSALVYNFGAFMLFLMSILLILRSISRSITFPGSSGHMQKEAASEYLAQLSSNFEKIALVSSDLMSAILLVANQIQGSKSDAKSPPSIDINSLEERLRELDSVFTWLAPMQTYLANALKNSSELLVVKEVQTIKNLEVALSTLVRSRTDFLPYATRTLRDAHKDTKSANKLEKLIELGSKYLQASQAIKNISVAIRPEEKKNDFFAPLYFLLPAYLEGYEKISFPIMRELLIASLGAERVKVLGQYDGNVIDMLYIPCYKQFCLQSKDSNSAAPKTISSVGTVLMCAPNAGLYETLSQRTRSNSWIEVYTKMGFDVCVFNYRGYNESSGVPTPFRMKSDGVVLVNYLAEVKGVNRILVHGESIGGMVATHIATHGPYQHKVKFLVCDKTFASLDCVGARLMGTWTSWALRYLGLWRTNVVADYLKAKCSKVIIQDPGDHIVAHPGSLKIGVATSVLLGDKYFLPLSVPLQYNRAIFLNESVPDPPLKELGVHTDTNDDGWSRLLVDLDDPNKPLHLGFIVHFACCVMQIARTAKISAQCRKDRQVKQMAKSVLNHCSSVEIMSNKDSSEGNRFLAEHNMGKFDKYMQTQMHSDLHHVSEEAVEDSDEEDINASGAASGNRQGLAISIPSDETVSPSKFPGTPHPGSLKNMSDQHADGFVPFVERLWNILVRIDGGSGELLGHAVRGGADGIRAWICSYVLFHQSIVFKDSHLPNVTISVEEGLQLIKGLSGGAVCCSVCGADSIDVEAHVADGVAVDVPEVKTLVHFIVHGLHGLKSRRELFASRGSPRADADSTSPVIDTDQMYISLSRCLKSSVFERIGGRGSDGSSVEREPLIADEAPLECKQKSPFGYLIPVHCGHNGWLHEDSLDELRNIIRTCGEFEL